MRLLFVYTEFLHQDGTERFHRGFSHLSLNFSIDRRFSYQDGILAVTPLSRPIPLNFFGERIYNVTTLVGDNGAGKTTILHYLIKLLQQFYRGQYRGRDRGLLVVEVQTKIYVLEYHGEHQLRLEKIPDGYECVPFHASRVYLSTTKLIYLANTLTYSDLELVRQQPLKANDQYVNLSHFRHEFLYNCSTASLIVENCQNDSQRPLGSSIEYLNSFFNYEQYKQVKYVFDKHQYNILKELRKEGHPVPVPKKLIVELQCEDYSSIFKEYFDFSRRGFLSIETLDEQYDWLIYELCSSCVESFLKTAMLYTKETYYNLYKNIINEKPSWREFSDSNHNARRRIFLDTLMQIYHVYQNNSEDHLNEENEFLIQRVHESCIDFINFILKKREQMQRYFEMQVIRGGVRRKEKQTITFSVRTTGEAAIWFITFLQKYRYTCEPYYYLKFHWGLSSGEQNLLRLFSSLYYIFDADYTNPERGDYRIYNVEQDNRRSCDSLLLWLDEADLTYHPEWQRRFLSILTAFLPKIYPRTCCQDMQILLTTHSPLMLGDSPAHSVIYLSKDAEGNVTVDDSGLHQTFGENLYMLLQNSFAVKDGAIGALVQNKIQEILKTLEELDQEFYIWTDKKEVSMSKIQDYQDKLQKYKDGIVAHLADGIIKNKLETEIDQCLQRLEKYAPTPEDESNPRLDELSYTELERQIKDLTEELERRRGELS